MQKPKAYVSGIEVKILGFYQENNLNWCKVYVPSIDITTDYLTSWIEVRTE